MDKPQRIKAEPVIVHQNGICGAVQGENMAVQRQNARISVMIRFFISLDFIGLQALHLVPVRFGPVAAIGTQDVGLFVVCLPVRKLFPAWHAGFP